ncbi:MAG: ribonuclease H family protein [Pseudomonadales bacterium]
MAAKYYVVWNGREPGIYEDWATAQRQTSGWPSARFKSFKTREEAQSAYAAGSGRPAAAAASRSRAVGVRAPGPGDYDVSIYCDGACQPNPGKAGSGIAIYRGGVLAEAWYGFYSPSGTNNTAELNALLVSLEKAAAELAAGRSVQVLADSQYGVNCITRWADGWAARGWKRKGGEIRNLDLVQRAHAAYQATGREVHVGYVAAHSGIEGNEIADRMAVLAVDQRQAALVGYSGAMDAASMLTLRSG